MGKAGRPAKRGPENATRLLAYLEREGRVSLTRADLASRVGLTPKQLRRAEERLRAESKIDVVPEKSRRFGGHSRLVQLRG